MTLHIAVCDDEETVCSGIEALIINISKELDLKTDIDIYVSGHEKYHSRLFDVQPYNFIKKPVDAEIFNRVFIKACKKVTSQDAFFEFLENRVKTKVKLNDIMYFESKGRIINIHTQDRLYTTYGKLTGIVKRITRKNFIQIHKSFFINMDYVKKIWFNKLIMSDNLEINISEPYQNAAKERYTDNLKENCDG